MNTNNISRNKYIKNISNKYNITAYYFDNNKNGIIYIIDYKKYIYRCINMNYYGLKLIKNEKK
jgi:hypothetical protein